MVAALIEALKQEHADMRRLLDLIKEQADTAVKPDFDLLQEIVAYCLTYPDQYHHPKEDLIYAALRRHDPEAVLAIDDIEAEHRELAICTRELATTIEAARAAQAPIDGFRAVLRSFVRTYRDHMRKEDLEFFPYALSALETEEWSDLEAEVTDPTDPLMRTKAYERFDKLMARDETG